MWAVALWIGCGGDGEALRSAPTPPTVEAPPVAVPVVDARAEVHPEFGSVLVVRWEQAVAGDVHASFSVPGGRPQVSPVRARAAGPQQELLLGVPYGADVTWSLIADASGGRFTTEPVTTRTAELPAGVPVPLLQVSEDGYDDAYAPFWFVGLGADGWYADGWWLMILDRAGQVVWARPTPPGYSSMHARVARDQASLLVDYNTYWPLFDGGAGSYVEQLAIDGSVLHTFATPGLHHPFTDLPDGSLAYGATSYDVGEALRVVSRDGDVETVWECAPWLATIGVPPSCGSNTLTYDEPSDSFLFSFYSTESIVQIGRDGAVSRWWGHLPGSWAFDPPESAFFWQHGPLLTDDGTLLLSAHSAGGAETVVREYAVDAANETLREVFSYGVGSGELGDVMGDVVRLPNGNTLHNLGSFGRIREITPAGEVVWEVGWLGADLGRSTPITDLYTLMAPAGTGG